MPGAFSVTAHDGRRTIACDEPAIGHLACTSKLPRPPTCVSAGQLESVTRPLADSIRMLQVLDAIQWRIGASVVPGESALA